MKMLDKNEALKLLESFEKENIELDDLTRNACSIIYSVAEQMTWETNDPIRNLFEAIKETAESINELRRYNIL